MERFITAGRSGDGGYPLDSDLNRMCDEGGPFSPDPARWADPDWRDNLGEWDTFADEVPVGSPVVIPLADGEVAVRGKEAARSPGACQPVPLPTGEPDPGDRPGADAPGAPWASIRVEGCTAAVFFHPLGAPAGPAG